MCWRFVNKHAALIRSAVVRYYALPWSLSARLALGFSAASLMLLLATTAFPYWALSYNLDREDNESLIEKVQLIADIVSRHSPASAPSIASDELVRAAEPEFSEPVFVRVVRSPGAQVVIQSPGMSILLPSELFPPPTDYPWSASTRPELVDRQVAKHRAMRLLAARMVIGHGPDTCLIQVGLDRTTEARLLETYRHGLALLLAVGLAGAAIAGYAIARRGLAPIRRMADAVAGIGSTTLHARLPSDEVPAELASLAAAFDAMLGRLQDGFTRLSQFSSDIAHELRTPLNNVSGLIELTLSKADRPPHEREELMTLALTECGRLAKLIDSLLFLARSENPQTQLRRQSLNLREELESLQEFYEPSATEAGISLVVDAPSEPRASLDRILLQRAVANLVENAIVHTPAGGTITLNAEHRNGMTILSVTDTGSGIPPEHFPRIFDRFHRVDASRSKHTGGLGLGLAIVRSIALMHGGEAKVSPRPGGGTQFTLLLPQMTGI
jgi:two-component system, OmpR family, heavy metal sensor histidine kinase CusS